MAALSPPVPHAHHPVAIGGPSRRHPGAPAVLVDVEADDFAEALAAAITATAWPRFGWPAALPLPRLPDEAGGAAPRALFQPIHRRFNLVLLDTHCALFGTPRLDPAKVESSGFVVRRWIGPAAPDAAALADPRHWQGWTDGPGGGWRGFANAAAFDADPDPPRRPSPRTGSAGIDARLAALRSVLPAETVNPLHALLPEVNAHARRSLLWGVVPTGDARRVVQPAAVDYASARVPGADRDAFLAHLAPDLSRRTLRALPAAGGRFDAGWLDEDDPLDAATDVPDGSGEAARRAQFTAFVRQLALEFDLLGRGAALLPLLDELPIGWQRSDGLRRWRETAGARAFLASCVRVVTDPDAPAVALPDDIGPAPDGWTARFADAALDVLQARAADARTLAGRFDDAQAQYAIRAFLRVRGEPGCPTRLVWSDLTPRYTVAPWYASTGAPQARIALPAFDRASLAAMTPNVAFEVPPALQNLLMRNKPADLLKQPKDGGTLGLGWICSFSIPIITLCAFILLNIVLSLLNLVFFWLPLVKICLPVPRRK